MRCVLFAALCGAVGAISVGRTQMKATHNGHVDGFTISSMWSLGAGGIEEHVMSPSPVHEEAKRDASVLASLSDFDPSKPSKGRTMTLAKLCQVLWLPLYKPDDLISSVSDLEKLALPQMIAEGDTTYGGTSLLEEQTLVYEATLAVAEEFGFGNQTNMTNEYLTGLAAEDAQFPFAHRSIFAQTWTSLLPSANGKRTSFLVFRGAAGAVDFAEAALIASMYSRVVGGWKQKKAWIEDAGLLWTPQQEAIAQATAGQGGPVDQSILIVQYIFSLYGLNSLLPKGLMPVVERIGEAFVESAEEQGTFPLLAGYSLGGTRAAAASMYLRGKGKRVEAITFGSLGSACWGTGAFLTNTTFPEVNAYFTHDQITDYAHPLDKYGHHQLAEVGNQCLHGKSAAAKPTLARAARWCNVSIAMNPAYIAQFTFSLLTQKLMASTGGMNNSINQALAPLIPYYLQPLPTDAFMKLASFEQCQQVSHSINSIVTNLATEIQEDGTTLSGCSAPAMPLCPGDVLPPVTNAPSTQTPTQQPTTAQPVSTPVPVGDSDDDWFGSDESIPVFVVLFVVVFAAALGGGVLIGKKMAATATKNEPIE